MAIEIVDLSMKNGGSFHSFLYVYQRVVHPKLALTYDEVSRSRLEYDQRCGNQTWQLDIP